MESCLFSSPSQFPHNWDFSGEYIPKLRWTSGAWSWFCVEELIFKWNLWWNSLIISFQSTVMWGERKKHICIPKFRAYKFNRCLDKSIHAKAQTHLSDDRFDVCSVAPCKLPPSVERLSLMLLGRSTRCESERELSSDWRESKVWWMIFMLFFCFCFWFCFVCVDIGIHAYLIDFTHMVYSIEM